MKILILTNDYNCKVVKELKKDTSLNIDVNYEYEYISNKYDVVFAHNYDKIIPKSYFSIPLLGIFVLHSTDLPKGRGWAPIYYSIARNESIYTISLLKISEKVDKGNIFIKLKIDKPKIITNINLREIDEDGVIFIINKFITMCKDKAITKNTKGLIQDSTRATYNDRRTPEDNILNSKDTLEDSIYKILATNSTYPSFIELNGEKIYLGAKLDKHYTLNKLEYKLEVLI